MTDYSLGDLATAYLTNLGLEEREASQQEINRFLRWHGRDRSLSGLTAPDVGNYAEWVVASGLEPEKLEPVRGFLRYAQQQGYLKSNLAVHLKVKKAARKKTTAGGSSPREAALTAEGYEVLKQELEALKQERPQVHEELRRAAADKDVRENAPLEAARESHGWLESRIRKLETMLQGARVVGGQRLSQVGLGHRITLVDMNSGGRLQYTLVDPWEADPTNGKISVASPVGKALLGRYEGEVVEVNVPAGKQRYCIEAIELQS